MDGDRKMCFLLLTDNKKSWYEINALHVHDSVFGTCFVPRVPHWKAEGGQLRSSWSPAWWLGWHYFGAGLHLTSGQPWCHSSGLCGRQVLKLPVLCPQLELTDRRERPSVSHPSSARWATVGPSATEGPWVPFASGVTANLRHLLTPPSQVHLTLELTF